LVEKGAGGGALNVEGYTPLLYACENYREKTIEMLLEYDADPHFKNHMGQDATLLTKNHPKCALLVKQGIKKQQDRRAEWQRMEKEAQAERDEEAEKIRAAQKMLREEGGEGEAYFAQQEREKKEAEKQKWFDDFWKPTKIPTKMQAPHRRPLPPTPKKEEAVGVPQQLPTLPNPLLRSGSREQMRIQRLKALGQPTEEEWSAPSGETLGIDEDLPSRPQSKEGTRSRPGSAKRQTDGVVSDASAAVAVLEKARD
jgi:hypothetical protein